MWVQEHKGAVNSIKVKASSGEECVTASSDGSCIIWDLTTFHRRSSLFANTLFKAVLYHPDESQLVTAGLHVMQPAPLASSTLHLTPEVPSHVHA